MFGNSRRCFPGGAMGRAYIGSACPPAPGARPGSSQRKRCFEIPLRTQTCTHLAAGCCNARRALGDGACHGDEDWSGGRLAPLGLGQAGVEAMSQRKRSMWPGAVVSGLLFLWAMPESKAARSNPTPGLSRASSRSEGRAEAVGVGCRPMLGAPALMPWPVRPVLLRSTGVRALEVPRTRPARSHTGPPASDGRSTAGGTVAGDRAGGTRGQITGAPRYNACWPAARTA